MLKILTAFLLLMTAGAVGFMQVPPKPSISSIDRSHQRIERKEVAGKRIPLKTLNGATLFVSPKYRADRSAPLIVHFHGAPWLVERHIAKALPRAALITVQLGAGSSTYGKPFADAELLPKLLAEVRNELGVKNAWSSITLTGFSAGYGAVRAILRQSENYKLINRVLLLDGIHASYEPEGKGLTDGGKISPADLDSFVEFAKDAVAGKKTFVLTHSEIVPGAYASTTECVDYLLGQAGLKRKSIRKKGPMGMAQLSSAGKRGFYVFGYAGDTAPDHVDHLHAMPFWFLSLRAK